jgi:hypothetical protein
MLSRPGSSRFYLFPPVKLAVKGQCFCDAKDIRKTAKEGLKRLSKNGLQECFEHLYSCCQKLQKVTDYFEGNVA